MLQQTTVATVIDRYTEFLKRFPNVQSLARAAERDVLKAWEGLGYYRRARNLHKASQLIVRDLGGIFPSTKEAVLKLPGIGRYTAGAILSIAFRQSEAALDGNLIRVYSRLYAIKSPVDDIKVLKRLWSIANFHKPTDASIAREFAEGMMELGAMICTPRNPSCERCPVIDLCLARKRGLQESLPRKGKKISRLKHREEVFVLMKNRRLALMKTGADPKFPDFRRLPHRALKSAPKKYDHRLKYSVTNRDFEVFVSQQATSVISKKYDWLTKEQVEKALLPAIDRKIFKIVFG